MKKVLIAGISTSLAFLLMSCGGSSDDGLENVYGAKEHFSEETACKKYIQYSSCLVSKSPEEQRVAAQDKHDKKVAELMALPESEQLCNTYLTTLRANKEQAEASGCSVPSE